MVSSGGHPDLCVATLNTLACQKGDFKGEESYFSSCFKADDFIKNSVFIDTVFILTICFQISPK